jgi:hypothetical protein
MDNKKRRRALTDADRLIIRKRNQEHPPGHQKELVDWFTATTGHPLNQSQVSKILSSTYDYLDGAHTQGEIIRYSRRRIGALLGIGQILSMHYLNGSNVWSKRRLLLLVIS